MCEKIFTFEGDYFGSLGKGFKGFTYRLIRDYLDRGNQFKRYLLCLEFN